ncbi:hypothetical protein KL86CIT2_200190 [uncultured Citrobacter sp.]|uniref:Uncharacterized protein n=1 Tax=uncultured Citrobacter sp. TaxID=200446 RepID=A0A212I5X9_9ENTR|nr:hypothetical protein KL86CIT2_200190 [uncultured Citrobacter sp.]
MPGATVTLNLTDSVHFNIKKPNYSLNKT